MFGRMMNNYYYGKSGKGDFRKEDMPENRRQLFKDTLRTRLAALCRINLIYVLVLLPMMIVMIYFYLTFLTTSSTMLLVQENDYESYIELITAEGKGEPVSEEIYNQYKENPQSMADLAEHCIFYTLLWLVPCISITGPFTAGLSYVTRNWARDEHAFIWADYKDAVKANWKQGLILSVITSILPLAAYVGWKFYGRMAGNGNMIMVVPQVLVVLVAVIWAISITYMHPLAVSYELKTRDVIRNGVLLGVARLPMSVGIRLLHCVPTAIGVVLVLFWNPMIGALILFAYYVLIGFALSRFVTASYTNAVFDRFINPRIKGAKVNQGLRQKEDDEDAEDAEDAEDKED